MNSIVLQVFNLAVLFYNKHTRAHDACMPVVGMC